MAGCEVLPLGSLGRSRYEELEESVHYLEALVCDRVPGQHFHAHFQVLTRKGWLCAGQHSRPRFVGLAQE